MSSRVSQGLVVTRTINRVIVVEKKPPEPQNDGCSKGCGCLALIAALLFVLGAIGSCNDSFGKEPAPPHLSTVEND